MKRHNYKLLLTAILCFTGGWLFGDQLPQGKWNCVALTPRHLALTGDYSELQLKLFRKRFAERRKIMRVQSPWERELWFDLSGTEAIASYRPQAARLFQNAPEVKLDSDRGKIAVTGTGYWISPIGQTLFPDETGNERFSRNADVVYHLFLTLSRPLADGEKLTITMPAGEKVDFTYRFSVPTPVFKINQVGYMPDARKFAYVGAWLGTAGKLPLFREFTGKQFKLIDATNDKTVHTGLLHPRPHDQYTKGGTPFTGEEILELDISDIVRPGKYYLAVDGIGRSMTFRIDDDTMAEAFYIHARGIYHQRCGIARSAPYTKWALPICHEKCIRGNFPPDIEHYSNGGDKRPYGFRNAMGKSMKVSHFRLIADNVPAVPEELPLPGGWHDAADWDRRPQHLGIVGDLCAVYLMKPENFCDGQLNLPESGNGVPDILDEACWGIEHLRLKQQANGGVGTWIETIRHPGPADGASSDDRLTYYLSCATRGSTIEYAAYAAELALALRRAGAARRAELYLDSAQRAWEFATNPANRVSRSFNYRDGLVFYREGTNVSPIYLLKAGFDLFQLTGDERYMKAAEKVAKSAASSIHEGFSPFIWIELELFQCSSAELNRLRSKRRNSLLNQAKNMLRQLESNYPIRAPWYGVDEGWSHTMSWGHYHPLRRAMVLIAAHAITGRKAFLDGACLANDFHNGANPSGSSMTSGLGVVYPVRFLDLNSYADGIAEPMPGITPYRNTYGIPRAAIKTAFGLFFKPERNQKFAGFSLSLLPREGLSEGECAKAVGKLYPIWHRWANVESRTVAASEFTVWETIAPAAATTGYLLNGPIMPKREWLEREPADDIRKLPGYAPLP